MTNNPFIQKAQQRKEQARRTALNHVTELEKLYRRFDSDTPTRRRIGERLEEAKRAARALA